MGRLIREFDWSRTPLGAIASWPQSLRTAVDMILQCRFPMIVLWTRDLIQIYNDGYAGIMAEKHPAGLGETNQACWPEVWAFNRPIYERVLSGEAVTLENQLYPLERRGFREDVYLTLCYSPIHDESGAIAGVLVTIFETTDQVKAQAEEARARDELNASEARYRALASAASHSQFQISVDGSRLLGVLGGSVVQPASTGASEASWFESYVHPDNLPAAIAAWREAVASEAEFRVEHRGRKPDGSWGWVLTRVVPVRDPAGKVVEWIGSATDVTARRLAEEETRSARDFAERIVAAVREPLVVLDDAFRVVSANPSFFQTFKLDPDTAGSLSVFDLDECRWDTPALRAHLEAVLDRNEPLHDFEMALGASKEERRDLLVSASGIGQLRQVLLTIEDVTERKAVEERQRLLVRELDHRAKNMLSVVQSIVQLTKAESPVDFAEAVIGRIGALARAHSLLSSTKWKGASIRQLLQHELAPFRGATISLAGEEWELRPEATQPLALAIHELATNAAKYGALSTGGRLEVSWEAIRERSMLELVWRESGGPKVQPPSRIGFGSSLIQAAIERQLGGSRCKTWDADGLVCEIEIPLERVDIVATEKRGEGEMAGDAVRVLLVEDDALIALDMEHTLKELGYAVSGPYGGIDEALRAIETDGALAAAVVDANLEGVSAAPVVERLRERGIPFLVATGYADVPDFGDAKGDVAVLSKPVSRDDLERALKALVGESGPG